MPRAVASVIVELFAGAGGAALGIRAALPGVPSVLVECDRDACTTARAAGFAVEERRIEVGGSVVARPMLVWASPPCQPYSYAGDRAGAADPRDGWPATLDYVRRSQPRHVVVENVRGSPAHEWAAQLRLRGYHAAVWDLDAADFGVPQHRRRRFVVATRDRLPLPPRPSHRDPTSLDDGRPVWRTIRDALPGLEAEAREAWASAGCPVPPSPERPAWWHRASLAHEVCRTIGTKANATVDVALHYTPGTGRAASEPWRLDRPSPTVVTVEVKGTRACRSTGWTFHGGPDRASDAAFLAVGRRRLRVSECAALQGFPADYPWHGTSTSQYRQVGNAVPPALAEAVVRQIVRP